MTPLSRVGCVVGLVGLIGSATLTASVNGPELGKTAPPLHLSKVLQVPAGTTTSWEAFLGKVVVIDFWASRCEASRRSIPHWNELVDTFKGKQVQFLAITDENEQVVADFLKRTPIHSWVGLDDVGQSTHDAYHIQGIPTTVIVNQKGVVVAVSHPARLEPNDIEEVLRTGKSSLPPPHEMVAGNTVVGRYKGKIRAWDVVNEAIADGGTNILRSSLWLQIIGPDFIAKAFEYAHEADPDAILRYNDYSLEDPAKRLKLITLIKSLQQQHVPVMAIGSQTHVTVSSPSFEAEDQALTEMETLGLPIHITELDVNCAQGGQRSASADIGNNAATTQGDLVEDANQRLADAYAGLFRAFVKHDKFVKVVTFWGANDAVSWRANGKPLLFDANNQPKPAFQAVIRTAAGEQPKLR
jgi:thiol-disulfide isomerase/thioredoxin